MDMQWGAALIRFHRVQLFCDWLTTAPVEPIYYEQPEFAFFTDLTDDEIIAAEQEMVRRYVYAANQHGELVADKILKSGTIEEKGNIANDH